MSATGHGLAQLPSGFSALTFEIKAKQQTDGKTWGAFALRFANPAGLTTDFAGEVTCVASDPVNNRAWIAGVITANNSTNPVVQGAIHQPGRDIWFRVVDNGEGFDASPDRSTVPGFTGSGGILTSAQVLFHNAVGR